MAKIDSERAFRVAYEHALQAVGAYTAYMASMERQGVPDLYWCGLGCSGWQELKFVDKLPSRSQAGVLGHRLTGQQRLFLASVCEQGALGVVALGMPMTLVGPYPAGVIGVSFFFPGEFDAGGQLTRAQVTECPRRAIMTDGAACVRVMTEMHTHIAGARGRAQKRLL